MAANYMSLGTVSAIQTTWEGRAPYVGFHTATPGTTGASESAIARVALTWSAHSATATLVVPGGTTITHLGFWSASSAGTYSDGSPCPTSYVGPTTVNLTIGPDGVTSNN